MPHRSPFGHRLSGQSISFGQHLGDLAFVLSLCHQGSSLCEAPLKPRWRIFNDHLERRVSGIAIGVKDVAWAKYPRTGFTPIYVIVDTHLGDAGDDIEDLVLPT